MPGPRSAQVPVIKRPGIPFAVIRPISVFLLFASGISAGEPAPAPARTSHREDTATLVWVIFRDKHNSAPRPPLSARARERRARAGFIDSRGQDRAVSQEYIGRVEALGLTRRHTFSWANAASFRAPVSRLGAVAALPEVARIVPLRAPALRGSGGLGLGKSGYGATGSEANSLHLSMLGIPEAHRQIEKSGKRPGEGVIIGFFDTGFDLRNRLFDHLRHSGAVVGDSDFVTPRRHDPRYADHGTQTLSLVAGYDPGRFTGAAWGASFVLARTEDNSAEYHGEEDNWAAALVWAEALGATVINSSVAYRDGFDDFDYTFEDLDGATTIISRAAAGAVARGVIIVNSVGNDGHRGASSLSAPADVEGVIAVGAVNTDSSIFHLSSRGPAANGKIVPDLVAPGTAVYAAATAETGLVSRLAGTSYSAPFISGICALIMQSHPGQSAKRIRHYLFSSCYLLKGQDSIDNTYGRGLPNAFRACTADSAGAYVQVRDIRHIPVAFAPILDSRDSLRGHTDSAGLLRISIASQQTLPETLHVRYGSDYRSAPIVVGSTPSHVAATIVPNRFRITVVDSTGTAPRPIPGAVVFWTASAGSGYVRSITDARGEAAIYYFTPQDFHLYVDAPGYLRSTTHSVTPQSSPAGVTIALTPRWAQGVLVYPSVVSLSGPSPRVNFDFLASRDDPRSHNQHVRMAVRSADGALVWSHSEYLQEYSTPSVVFWNCRNRQGRAVVPGVYWLILQYGGKSIRRMFLIRP